MSSHFFILAMISIFSAVCILMAFDFTRESRFPVKMVFEDGNVNGVEIYLWNWDAYAEGSFKSYWIATSSQQNFRFVMSYCSFDRPRTVEA